MEKINPTTGAADTPEPKVERSTADSFYCYIGPSITGLIQHGAIYRGRGRRPWLPPLRPSRSTP